MLKRGNPVGRHTRWPVRWSVAYGNQEFIADGTVLDVTYIGWRAAGPPYSGYSGYEAREATPRIQGRSSHRHERWAQWPCAKTLKNDHGW